MSYSCPIAVRLLLEAWRRQAFSLCFRQLRFDRKIRLCLLSETWRWYTMCYRGLHCFCIWKLCRVHIGSLHSAALNVHAGQSVVIASPVVVRRPTLHKLCLRLHCSRYAQRPSVLCVAHIPRKNCAFVGCNNRARKSSLFCHNHCAGKHPCIFPSCQKIALYNRKFCVSHVRGSVCSFLDCDYPSKSRSFFCVQHYKRRRICVVVGCDTQSRPAIDYCGKHSYHSRPTADLCCFEDCNQLARTCGGSCYAHGGGRRCSIAGCIRGARTTAGFCQRHASQRAADAHAAAQDTGIHSHHAEPFASCPLVPAQDTAASVIIISIFFCLVMRVSSVVISSI